MVIRYVICFGTVVAAALTRGDAVGFRSHPHPICQLTNAALRTSASADRLRLRAVPPSRYDLRDVGGVSYLSPIRNQGSYGTCWTFSTMAGLEWCMRNAEGLDANLSENNLANMHGFGWGYGDGGNNEMAVAVLLREEAPVTEALDPYPHPGASVRERGVRIPRKVVFVPMRTSVSNAAQLQADLDAIKQAIMDYGPLSTSYHHNDTYSKGSAYYCTDTLQANHAVSIIGWDDGYSAANFKNAPPGDGAFIIRNSWGTGRFENGYMYISYYDVTLGFDDVQVAYAALSSGSDYGKIYQHDPQGYVGYTGYRGFSTIHAANVFVARTNETLSAFGFYALQKGLSYTASIVRNAVFDNGTLSGEWITVKTGTCPTAGYEVIPFDVEVEVAAASRFAVVVGLSASSVEDIVPVSFNVSDYVTNVTAAAGLSLMCPNPERYAWNDNSAGGRYFCCKVYTKAPSGSVTTSTDAPVPCSWLDLYAAQHGSSYLEAYYCGCYNALAEHVAGNGIPIAASFERGLDPDNAAETNLTATIAFDANGNPVIGIAPRNTALWNYTVLGSGNLVDWHSRIAADHFFKVSVQPNQ